MKKKRSRFPKFLIPKVCRYCGSEVSLVSNKEIYGREHGNGKCYKCSSCDSYVGVHPDLITPLGLLANKRLRNLKKAAHALFDPIWRNSEISRSEAYRLLADSLGIPAKECHIGWFDEEMTYKALLILRNGNLLRKERDYVKPKK